MKKVSVSFLSSRDAASDLMKLDRTSADLIHVDIIDNKFIKGKGVSLGDLKYIENYTRKRLDIHLMVKDAGKYIKKLVFLNAEYVTFHLESKTNIEKTIAYLKKYGIKVGLSIKPNTNFEEVIPYLENIDLLLIMTVEPGKGGQEFIMETTSKISEAKKYITEKKLPVLIEVDGGINNLTKEFVKEADILVSGSYIVNHDNFQEAIMELQK